MFEFFYTLFQPLELEGHSKILTSLCLGHGYDPKLLVSAADDYVILWNLIQARQQLERGKTWIKNKPSFLDRGQNSTHPLLITSEIWKG